MPSFKLAYVIDALFLIYDISRVRVQSAARCRVSLDLARSYLEAMHGWQGPLNNIIVYYGVRYPHVRHVQAVADLNLPKKPYALADSHQRAGYHRNHQLTCT